MQGVSTAGRNREVAEKAIPIWNSRPTQPVFDEQVSLRLPERGKRLRFLASFVWLEAQACAFPFALVALLALTRAVELPWIARYDWMFVFCVLIQLVMVALRIETWRDAAVVGLFHLLGMGLELYKVSNGSWSYPGESLLAVGPVPLYAGFMYGSVASFMALAWRKHRLHPEGWPPTPAALLVGVLIYLQFFVPTWSIASRIAMVIVVAFAFRRCTVHFDCAGDRYWIPMPLAFLLIGSMIYVAENIATFLGAWSYPYQAEGWVPVHGAKLFSWVLLMTVSLIVVAEYKRRAAQPLPAVAEA